MTTLAAILLLICFPDEAPKAPDGFKVERLLEVLDLLAFLEADGRR